MKTKQVKWGSRLALMVATCGVGFVASAAGPDVIVGDMPDVSNFGVVGTAPNEIYAYSVGTTSCNLAPASPGVFKSWLPGYATVQDNALLWIDPADTTDPVARLTHPVISQNLYKLSGGRFTQLGQAWLKHGFCALQGTVCSTCTPGGNCNFLYPGCSDPYGSGLNGSQGGLGPKSEVNAANGHYNAPWINNGVGSGNAFKRLQARKTELTDAGATFIVACMYMQPEDRGGVGGYGVQNSYNSESYRRVTINQSTYAMTLADNTQRGKPAIQAWQDNDPTVHLSNVDVVNDGRFIVGSKVINLGGGQYRYEYAIQNFHSDRSGGSFSIPMPAGATVTNVGFHDVAYHSGEPYNGTDWAIAVSTGQVSWTCVDTYNASNDTGNALRWDTIYNFYFDCNLPAGTGAATIGLYKPGQAGDPTSVPAGVRLPSVGGNTHPENDDYLFALPITQGTAPFTTTGATTDGHAETTCSAGGVSNDVWFRYSAAISGDTTLSLCGSAFDTKMYVYPGASNPTDAATLPIACNDDDPLCPTGDARQSRISFNATAGLSYLVRVGGKNGAMGDGSIEVITPPTGPQIPVNNTCAGATWAADGASLTGSLQLATNNGTATCGNSANSPDVWFAYKPRTSGVIFFDSCGSNFDTNIAIFTGTCGNLTQVACNDDAQTGACAGSAQSLAAIVGVANTTYYARLSSYNGQRGNYNFHVAGGGGVVPPSNDECTGRLALGAGTTPFTTLAASGTSPDACTGQPLASDVWYNVNVDATTASRVAIYTTGANFDARLALYSGAGCASLDTRLLGCADGSGNDVGLSRIFSTNSNFTLRIGGNGAAGAGSVHVVVTCPFDLDNGSGSGIPDSAVTIDDLLYYLVAFEAGSATADLDNGTGTLTPDGAVTIDDLLAALGRFEGGC